MSLQSSLAVLIPSLVGVFLAIIVSAGAGCSHYSFGRASVDPCSMANPEERFEDLCGTWKDDENDRMIRFGRTSNDQMVLGYDNECFPLVRKGPGHYLFREGLYNWKGILVSLLDRDQLTLNTNDGHMTLSYSRMQGQ